MRVAIIDDEPPARQRLRELLVEHADLEIVGEAGGVREAVALCGELRPEVLFLDIEMGRDDGFALIEQLSGNCPTIVFVTAHEQFALSAFDVSAIDYLLKPVAPARLKQTLEKLRRHVSRQDTRIQITLDNGMVAVEAKNIACVQADQNYTRVFLRDGRAFYVRRGIQAWDELLPADCFERLHRSLIVNLDAVLSLQAESRDTGVLTVDGYPGELPLARRALQRLKQATAAPVRGHKKGATDISAAPLSRA